MRRRFVLVSLAVTALVIVVFAVPLGVMVRGMVEARAIGRAELQAAAMATVLTATTERSAIKKALATSDSVEVVHLPDEGHIGEGKGWAPRKDVERVRDGTRPVNVRISRGVAHLRPAPLPGGGAAVIEVLVPNAALTRDVATAWLVLAALGLAILAAAGVLADRLASGAVRATRRLAGAATRWGEGDLGVRVQPSGPPEIATVGSAFNTLADRFQGLLAAEREMVADLSHRLRTPLTALRLNAEALPPGESRQRVLVAAANLEREVDAIIKQARRPLASRRPAQCELVDVVRGRMRTWSALADDQGRRWAFDAPGTPIWVAVSESDVADAVDAIVGNVFRHTPEGAPYHVEIRVAGARAALAVEDGGPGIAEPETALLRGASGGASTGLGTDIARRVAEQGGGGIQVGPGRLGGAKVVLTLRVISLDSPRSGNAP